MRLICTDNSPSKLWVTPLLIGLMMLSFGGCVVRVGYRATPKSLNIDKGSIEFRLYNIESEIAAAHDTTDYTGTVYEEGMKSLSEFVEKYKSIYPVPSLTYLSLRIRYKGVQIREKFPLDTPIPPIRMNADSIFIRLSPAYDLVPVLGFKQATTSNKRLPFKEMNIEPITIPNPYKGKDLRMEFVLSIYDESTGVLLERRPVEIDFTIEKDRWIIHH